MQCTNCITSMERSTKVPLTEINYAYTTPNVEYPFRYYTVLFRHYFAIMLTLKHPMNSCTLFPLLTNEHLHLEPQKLQEVEDNGVHIKAKAEMDKLKDDLRDSYKAYGRDLLCTMDKRILKQNPRGAKRSRKPRRNRAVGKISEWQFSSHSSRFQFFENFEE
ncbi:uncharacterized protein BYT42DRAFT_589705 [Radiomyces spectabilis]|uniref:uncharacterized protein n=1 Tax=Radiomyces spectabilis TaxID=64574 RepID=UPI00221E8095|nr:uncharacterized protein BYT42DRAFT_589705 [Radiomyces spectabilis]KAI8365380.1 hypothetical protein BYT42DRAFT_589705 [Radiomyces spectabilis]